MFIPKYRILIRNECFPQDQVIGLGSQLISILNFIAGDLNNNQWCVFDVNAVKKLNFDCNNKINKQFIGSSFDLIQYCLNIDQFISGVFICFDFSFSSSNLEEIDLETEDAPYREIDCMGIIVEIRAFDTTYFALYTEYYNLIDAIACYYKVDVEENPKYRKS